MNKFYILSAVLHTLVVGMFLFLTTEEEIKFKEKKNIVVSVRNNRAISNNTEASSKPKNIASEIESEAKKNDEKIIQKKQEKKQENKVIKEVEKAKVKKIESPKKEVQYNEFQDNNRFLQGEDGVFTAISLEGIEYEILKEVDPKYPIRAKKSGYKGIGIIRVKFLVDVDGSVKNIEFLSGEQKFGFKEEVEKALNQWRFKPIQYKNKNIRVHFEKEFKFKNI
ncbi:TonB family protein [Cetobacterium sp. ZOR0034]|uniref:TonB family protein n=1 Tax=Cetobacterium sp. ZOR0034 TaxID=1339239 RepID=UPI00068EAABA|nr:TonB family protein [Cetobacterium sp. ZOR0034]